MKKAEAEKLKKEEEEAKKKEEHENMINDLRLIRVNTSVVQSF